MESSELEDQRVGGAVDGEQGEGDKRMFTFFWVIDPLLFDINGHFHGMTFIRHFIEINLICQLLN